MVFSRAVRALSWLRGSRLPRWARQPLARWGIGLIEACDFRRSIQTRLRADRRASFSVSVGLLGPSPINVFVVVAIYRTLKAGIVGLIPMDSDIWPWEIPGAVTKFVLGNAIVIPILDAITRILTIFFSVMLLVFVVLVIVLGLWLPKIYARLDQRLGGPEPDAGRRVQDYLFFLASLPFLGVFLLGEFDGNERSTLLGVSATVLTLASLIIGITAQLRYRKIAGFGLDRTSRRASVLPWFLGFWGLETSAWFVMTIQGLLASPSWNQP